jgi:tetratricopeptide (TPR) repeat protein
MDTTRGPIRIFYGYHEEDKGLQDNLRKQLLGLEDGQFITQWYRDKIPAGADEKIFIYNALNTAQIILLLVSPDFMDDDDCRKETEFAMKRHNSGSACVIPVQLRPVDPTGALFGHLEFLPRDKQAIKSSSDPERAFNEVAKELRKIVYMLYLQYDPSKKLSEILRESYQKSQDDWINAGKEYNRVKNYEKALIAYDLSLLFDDRRARAHRYKGKALYNFSRYEEALSEFERAVKLDPSSIDAWNDKGAVLLSLGHYKEAIAACEQASQLDSSYALPHINRGRALFSLDRYLESLQAYNEAIQLDSSLAKAYEYRADTFERLGRFQDARRDREAARGLRH